MQVGCYTRAHPFELNHLRQPVTVYGIDHEPDKRGCNRKEPPSLPHRRCDPESGRSGRFTCPSVRAYGAHLELIAAGCESQINGALERRFAPVSVRSEFIL